MTQAADIAIIGAGLAGLTCARDLARHGVAPVLFDKGRGLGGRLSTRRADGGFQFDHGAQYLTPKTDGFRALLQEAESAGAAGSWPREDQDTAYVGTPGMTGLAKHLAAGLDIRRGTRITTIRPTGSRWQLDWDGGSQVFDKVVITAPAPQISALLPEVHPFSDALDAVEMAPCLAVMVGLHEDRDFSRRTWRNPTPDIAWIAVDSDKPGRPGRPCLVAHASPGFSVDHLEQDMRAVADLMRPKVSDVVGAISPSDVAYLSAHRWRYALTVTPLGQPFLSDPTRTLFAGGDWCLGAKAEDAWSSGQALAQVLLEDA